ncbi:FAD-binding protein [Arthrobacter sp. ATA002]|uniref:FAD-dependent oxidoreductase n=1 Tax=Arthrobacter sp. ATA002 TaxID=2991715 RepID=UPI0022A7A7D7|nr:FAD-dependent oxidoreductase [Arthrobacter sp. ATA002]WAP51313.1 FAD-binding protein [Arthrobacter sp. ATA002]
MANGQNIGQEWDSEYDVVVVGSGAGAMAGAFSAASRGLKTLVLEKTDLLGGASSYAGASCWLPGTQVQERAGVQDSREAANTFLVSLLGGDQAERREAFLATAPELVKALEHDPAIEFRWTAFPDYFPGPGRMEVGRSIMPVDLPREEIGELAALVRPRIERDRLGKSHPDGPLTAGQALIGRLLLALTNTGNGTVLTGTAMTGLVIEDGKAVGLTVEGSGGPGRVRARAGVLLGAGGFEANPQMRADNGTPGSADWTMAPAAANNGVAIRAAREAGGAVELMDQAWWCPGPRSLPETAPSPSASVAGSWWTETESALRMSPFPTTRWDGSWRRLLLTGFPPGLSSIRASEELPAIMRPDNTSPAEHLSAGTWLQAETVGELAELTGLPPAALTDTVARFNGFAESGVDEDFHRGEDPYDLFFTDPSHGPNPALVPVAQPPYFAARMVLSDLGTKGGLRTDPDARVLTDGGDPIPGLYAVGNTSASFSGRFYPGPGIPLGSAMVFAYRAVQSMAGGAAAG